MGRDLLQHADEEQHVEGRVGQARAVLGRAHALRAQQPLRRGAEPEVEEVAQRAGRQPLDVLPGRRGVDREALVGDGGRAQNSFSMAS
jgi:hypothetical protein